MERLLVYVVEEHYLWSFVFLWIIFFYSTHSYDPSMTFGYENAAYFLNYTELYRHFVVFMCLNASLGTMEIAKILHLISMRFVTLAWLFILFGIGFSAIFICIFHKLVDLKPGAYVLNIFYMFFYMFFNFFVAVLFICVATEYNNENFSLQTRYGISAIESMSGACVFAVPWILYFIFSSKMRNAWRVLYEEQNSSVRSATM